jgi:hypothetical protein
MTERQDAPVEILVFSVLRAATCSSCGCEIGKGALLRMEKEQPLCRARQRYERQGLLVEPEALERAEQECLNDEERRVRARERPAAARERQDAEYVRAFAERVRAAYPGCPAAEAEAIARHACVEHRGRVGRSAAARELDPAAITLATTAHVRHRHASYDTLLAKGWDRAVARHAVADAVQEVLRRWSGGNGQ